MDRFDNPSPFVVDWALPFRSAEHAECGEVRYWTHRNGWDSILVEATLNPDGTWLFEEQELGERGWFAHTLVPGEMEFARDLLRQFPVPLDAQRHSRFETFLLPVFGR